MSIPAGWTEITNGTWGVGDEPFPANVPQGVHYEDAFHNRCVATPDGLLLVEGIGTGVNAGKPDGEWWPYSPELAAGPTNAGPWIAADGEGTPEDASGHPLPAAEPTAEPVAPTPGPSLTIQKNADGRWEVRAVYAAGHIVTEAWDGLLHAMHNTWRWVSAHAHL